MSLLAVGRQRLVLPLSQSRRDTSLAPDLFRVWQYLT